MATRKQARRKRAQAAHAPVGRATGGAAPAAAGAIPAAPSPSRSFTADARERGAALVAHRAFPAVALTAIFGLSALVYALIAAEHWLPDVFPDEVLYRPGEMDVSQDPPRHFSHQAFHAS